MFFKNTYKIFFVITLLSVTLYGNENVKRYKELFNEDLRGDTLIIGNQALLNKDLDSSNYLKIPDNSTIKYAKLYWWGNFHGGSSALKHAYLKDSNQEELIKVNAEETIIYGKEYISSGEVTDLITGEKGEFQLDKVFPKSQSDVYGSWALQVVYENLDSTYKNISLYDGYIATSKNKKINIQFPKDRTIYGALGTVSKNLFKKTKFLKRESLYFENDLLFSGDKKLRITHNSGFQIFAKKNSFIPFFISSTKEKDEPKEYLLNYQQPKTFQTEEVPTETKPQYGSLKKGFYLGVGGGMAKGDFSSTWNINPPLYTTPLAKYTPSIYFNGGYKGENFRIYGELYDTMWKEANILRASVGIDYIFTSNILGAHPFIGVNGGTTYFQTDFTDEQTTGTTTGGQAGVLKEFNDHIIIEVGVKSNSESSTVEKKTDSYEFDIKLEKTTTPYIGINYLF